MVIQINVTDKHAKALGQPKIVCGNSGYSIKFTFDAGWGAETIKTARFVYMARGDVAYTDVVFTGDTVSVPVLSNVREVRVGVFEGDLHTTTPAVIPCERSIRCGTGAPADPTQSQYDQIMALLNNPAGANPLTAAVGQTVIVKSVDENGKPTEWEAVDFPECDVTSVNGQTGDVQTRLLVTITENEDGTYTSSHTSQEIYAASQAGAVIEGANFNGRRYQTYICSEQVVQFLTIGVSGGSGKRSLNTYAFLINGDKVIQSTTQTPIPVATAPMVGATASAAGTAGLVPKPAAGDQGKYLKGDGTWANIDCVQNPDTAAVGQTIVVKSVDENGKPTEWEAVDFSKGYRIIADVTLAETVSEIKIEKDTEDNPFELEDVYVYVSSILAEESTVEYSGSYIDIKACDVNGYTHHYHNACFIGSSLKPTAVPFTVRIKHLVDQNKDISILPTGNDDGTAQKTVTTNFIGKYKGWTAIPNGKIRGVLLRTFSPSAAFYGAGTRVMIIGR